MISAQISMVEYYKPFEKWLKSNKEKRNIPKKKKLAWRNAVGSLERCLSTSPVFTPSMAILKLPHFNEKKGVIGE